MKTDSDRPNRLDALRIQSPCAASWDAMRGDDRARHCQDCALSVHSLVAYSRKEAADLLEDSGGRLCLRIVRDADGRVLTRDDLRPRGLRRSWRRAASWLFLLLGLPAADCARSQDPADDAACRSGAASTEQPELLAEMGYLESVSVSLGAFGD
ncbi:MAG TPA: hypothetical protein VGC54_12760 [Planctomycetota bacterium]